MHRRKPCWVLFALVLAFLVLFPWLSAEPLPPWRGRVLEEPAEEEEERFRPLDYHGEQRRHGPFFWILAGFLATVFVVTL